MIDLLARRRAMMGGVEADPYEGVVWNKVLNPSNTLANNSKFCVTPFLPISRSGTYTLYFGATSDTSQITCFSLVAEDGQVSGAYRNRTSIELPPATNSYLRVSLIQANIDNCWVKDPDGQYLFKGKNV